MLVRNLCSVHAHLLALFSLFDRFLSTALQVVMFMTLQKNDAQNRSGWNLFSAVNQMDAWSSWLPNRQLLGGGGDSCSSPFLNFFYFFVLSQKNLRRAKCPSRQRRRRRGERHEIESSLQTSVCKRLHILFMQHLLWQELWTKVFVMDLKTFKTCLEIETTFIHVECQPRIIENWT